METSQRTNKRYNELNTIVPKRKVLRDCKNINNSEVNSNKSSQTRMNTKRVRENEQIHDVLQKDLDLFEMVTLDIDDVQSEAFPFDKHLELLCKNKQPSLKTHNSEQQSQSRANKREKSHLPQKRLRLTDNKDILKTPTTTNERFNISSNFFENDPFINVLKENCENVNKTDTVFKPSDLFSCSKSDPRIESCHLLHNRQPKLNKNTTNTATDHFSLLSNVQDGTSKTKTIEEHLENEFSQFCSSPVMQQLDNAILSENQSSGIGSMERTHTFNELISDKENSSNYYLTPVNIFNSISKPKDIGRTENKYSKSKYTTNLFSSHKEPETCIHKNNSKINPTFNSEYLSGVSKLFENVEQSILYNLRPNQGTKKNYDELEQFWNDTEDKTKRPNDCSNDTAHNKSRTSIGDVFKKALKKNATKSVSSQKLCNNTVINNKVDFQELGSFYGLPNKINELIKQYKGIDKLYDWQDECLKLPAIKNRKNLIYSLPTSGGKTLVAEILILREIICRKRNVIFVLPYVAIVQEKVWALSPFGVALDFLVEEYAAGKGTYPPRKRRHKQSVYVATTEKALTLINSLLEQGRLEELGLVVVDELHLIGDEQRGPRLEALLTELMYLNESIQIVGMSATIGNLSDIKIFLNADLYTGNFRPVELTEYVKCENRILKINWQEDENYFLTVVRDINFSYTGDLAKRDPDQIGVLVMEVIPKESCLIFCPFKKNCENVASLLCDVLKQYSFKELNGYKTKEKQQLLQSLKNEVETVCDILKLTIPYGIAYHHSGLTAEERKLIEDAYRAGVLNVICCTSTLAAGVNLPAKRVIIRKPYIAKDFINLSRYKQMVGRAGRAGLGEFGESILICTKEETSKVKKMFMMPMDQTLSRMHESSGLYLRNIFLSSVGLGLANTKPQLEKVTNMTLLAVQQEKLNVDLKLLVRKTLIDLINMGGIEYETQNSLEMPNTSNDSSIWLNSPGSAGKVTASENHSNKTGVRQKILITTNTKFVVSKLGWAAIKSGLELVNAHILYSDLTKAQECLVLLDCLHLLYLVTPYNFLDQVKPKMTNYYDIMMRLSDKERRTAAVLGISESCTIRMHSNQPIKSVPEGVLNRFYVSLMLFDLWNGASIMYVSDKYQVDRGIVQSLMTSAATFTSNVVTFCEELNEFWAFAHLLKGMSLRLSHCCVKELLPLMELPAVKQGRAKQLFNAGYKNLQSIAKADPQDLVSVIQFMPYKVAHQLIAAAKLLLVQKVETLREEAEELLNTQKDTA